MLASGGIVMVLAGGCSYQTAGVLAGAEVGQIHTFSVKAATDSPSTLIVEVSGEINGRATLTTHDGRVTSIGPGVVAEAIGGDYFEKEATIVYSPEGVTSGRLIIRYSLD